MNKSRAAALILLAAWLAPAARADSKSLASAQSDLAQARQSAITHHRAAAAALAKSRADAAAAALLAEQQIEAAAALRKLESQTGIDAATLAALQAQAAQTRQSLDAGQAALIRLLPVMQRLAAQPAATLLAAPSSPRDAVRGLLIIQGIAAGIEQQALAVRRQASSLASLLAQAQAAQTQLAQAAAVQQTAETALTGQIQAARAAEMTDADIAASETAAALAAGRQAGSIRTMVTRLLEAQTAQASLAIPSAPPAGNGGAPVAGIIIQNFGANTVAGPAVGVSYRAAPGARVVTPCAGPVLYADSFQSYGMLVIVDCGGGYDFVLSGMERLDVTAGQRIAHDQPIGEMLGYNAQAPARQPILYVELRQNGSPVDPARWLSGGGSG